MIEINQGYIVKLKKCPEGCPSDDDELRIDDVENTLYYVVNRQIKNSTVIRRMLIKIDRSEEKSANSVLSYWLCDLETEIENNNIAAVYGYPTNANLTDLRFRQLLYSGTEIVNEHIN